MSLKNNTKNENETFAHKYRQILKKDTEIAQFCMKTFDGF